MTTDRLHLYEEVMLLALHDEKGTLAGYNADIAIAGAVVSELILCGHISVEDTRRKLVNVLDVPAPADPVLAECLQRMRESKRRASMKNWIPKLSRIKDLRHKVARQLVADGILRANEKSFLGIFDSTTYPELNPTPERAIVARLREAIFADTGDVDTATALLVSLANSTQLLDRIFDRKEMRRRKHRVKKIVEGDAVGEATKEALDAINAAILVAVIIPAAAGGAIASS